MYKKIIILGAFFLINLSLYSLLPRLNRPRIRILKGGTVHLLPRSYSSSTELTSKELSHDTTKGFFGYWIEKAKNFLFKNNTELMLRKQEREDQEDKIRKAERILRVETEDLEDSLERAAKRREFQEKFLQQKNNITKE